MKTLVTSICIAVSLTALSAQAEVIRWDTGAVIPGTEDIEPGPGVQLDHWNTEERNLRYAQLGYNRETGAEFNLSGASFRESWLDDADFVYSCWGACVAANLEDADFTGASLARANLSGTNLTDARLTGANLTGADLGTAKLKDTDFTDARITGAMFAGVTQRGFYKDQLYLTASYQARDLEGIGLAFNDLTGWDFSGQNLAGARFYEATLTRADFWGADVQDANFEGTGFTKSQLYSTASYRARNLRGIDLSRNDLSAWHFSGQDLSHANLSGSSLANADLSGANVIGVNFLGTGLTKEQFYTTANYEAKDMRGITLAADDLGEWDFSGQVVSYARFGSGFTREQLYSTESYQMRDLRGFAIFDTDVIEWDLSEQNLMDASLSEATITSMNLSGADLRGADHPYQRGLRHRVINKDGRVLSLELLSGASLRIRNDHGVSDTPPFPRLTPREPIAISIHDRMTMFDESALELVFDADTWNSLISFEPGIPVQLGGELQLTFADDVDVTSQVGRTFRVFDWTGVEPSGNFRVSSPYIWDTGRLYTSGAVTLTAVPEPSTRAILLLALIVAAITWQERPYLSRRRIV